MDKRTLDDLFAGVTAPYTPVIVGELNGQLVKLVRIAGPFVWHHHEEEDEMFLVHRGRFRMEFRDRTVDIGAGEFIIVPRGVDHRPVADDEAEVILFEPASTLNTGNTRSALTRETLERL
jgi:mannose-6-phosphate isomerase-like protein (cupin superfamily)